MDQIVPRLLQFDRFTLDLMRACVRVGGRVIELSPKAFDVLRVLAENAGRLVSKQELYEAVWPNVTVTDDSLVQRIRELRQALGDDDHSLIKTVSRRGYLLDVPIRSAPSEALESAPWTDPVRSSRFGPSVWHRMLGRSQRRKWLPWALAATILCVAIGTILLARVLERPEANELFTEREAGRVAAIARDKELPVPAFQIARIDGDLPAELRRFVGIWVSTSGFAVSKRQFMLIITNVEKSGILKGIAVLGPRQPFSSPGTFPAGSWPFNAHVSGESFYSGSAKERHVTLLEQSRLEYVETWENGHQVRVILDPVWTLVEAERAAVAQTAKP
jgi:DNA-binding winged helix-turn-helix (wHTH) protein